MRDAFCNPEMIAKHAFYISKHVYAIYNYMPLVRGHIVVIPKRHVEYFHEMSEDETKDMLHAVKAITKKLGDIYGIKPLSYDIISQAGPYSGRTVKHLHIHIIPRKKGDMFAADGSSRSYDDLVFRVYALEGKSNFDTLPIIKRVKKLSKKEYWNELAILKKAFGGRDER